MARYNCIFIHTNQQDVLYKQTQEQLLNSLQKTTMDLLKDKRCYCLIYVDRAGCNFHLFHFSSV